MKLPRILTRSRRHGLLKLIVIGFAQAGVTITIALLIRTLFDGLRNESTMDAENSIWSIGSGLIISACLLAWLRLKEHVVAEQFGQNYIFEVRSILFRQLCRLNSRSIRTSHGSIFIRFVGDLTAIRRWISLGFARLTVATITTVGVFVALAFIEPILALSVFLIIGMGAIGIIYFGKPMQTAVKAARRRRSRLAATISDRISSFSVIQAFGQIKRERSRMQRESKRLSDAMVTQAKAAGRLRAITEATTILATTMALIVGSLLVFNGQGSVGTMIATMAIVGILTSPLRDLGRSYEYWRTAQIAKEKIQSFLQKPRTVRQTSNAIPLIIGSGHLVLQDVSVEGAIKGISAEVTPGSRVAIVGPNGSGKSTLLSLVPRLFDPDSGKILIDDQDISSVTLKSLRKAVSIVGSDLPLLRGSVNRNLRYRNRNISQEKLEKICHMCGLDQLLNKLPQGLDTKLSSGGQNLSVGQRQRLMLARALVGEPKILLLDEADANFDPKTRLIFEQIIIDFPGSILLITHHPEILQSMDQIWHLEHGRLVEAGSPQELLNRSGKTKHLFTKSIFSHPDIIN